MKTFEQRLGLQAEEKRLEFAQACKAVFNGGMGQRLMNALCQASHPMGNPVGSDAYETGILNGQREVVATLFRFSQLSPSQEIHE